MNSYTKNLVSTFRSASVPVGRRSYAIPIFYLLAIMTTLLSSTSWAANSLTQYAITWTFNDNIATDTSEHYQYGTFANGDYWIRSTTADANVTIVDIDPLCVDSEGRIMHG